MVKGNNQIGVQNSPQPEREYFTLVPKSEIEFIQTELREIKSLIQNSHREKSKNEWITKDEARKRLHVCLKTLDTYLSKKIIPYSRFSGKIYIKASDIELHLERNYISKYKSA